MDNAEEVKGAIANKKCSNAYKESLVEAYDYYCRANGIQWFKPFYERYDKLPQIPSEEKISMLIANAGKKYSLILSLSRDLAIRPIELTWLKVGDLDLENGRINITTAKYGVGRTLKVRDSTLAMLKRYVSEKGLGLNDRLFPVKETSISEHFRRLRNKLAEKLQDITFKQIRLYDFRHFTATKTYQKTKDLMYLKSFLGHKDLRSTLRYLHLVDFQNTEYICKVATNVKEASELVEAGFDFVVDFEGSKLFRKPK